MIKSAKILMMIALLGVLITYSNCGGSKTPAKPIQEVQLEKLAKTWKVTGVTLDGVDKKADYTNMTLTITGTPTATSYSYTTASRPALSPWKASGTWTYGTDPATQIVRDADNAADKLDVTYSVSETQLQLNFTFNGSGYTNTRSEVVKGVWVFTFGL